MDKEMSELDTIWDEARNQIQSGHQDKAVEIYKYILVRYADDPVANEYANAYLGEISTDSSPSSKIRWAVAPGIMRIRIGKSKVEALPISPGSLGNLVSSRRIPIASPYIACPPW